MKLKTLLSKLKAILKSDREEQLAKRKSLKKVLKSLKNEKGRLETELAQAESEEMREEIRSQLKIIFAQRTKGLKLLKKLMRTQ